MLARRSAHDGHPPLGLGTWPLTGPDATRAVLSGIDAGYRLVDTATIYDNEDAVGVALAECGLPREELFVTTKLRGAITCRVTSAARSSAA